MLKTIIKKTISIIYLCLCLFIFAYLFFINSSFNLIAKLDINSNTILSREVYLFSNSSNCAIRKEENFFSAFTKYGESIEISDYSFDVSTFLSKLNAKLIKIENTESGISYYAYTSKIKYCKQLFSNKVNLHIFISNSTKEVVKIGTPLIFSSY